MKSHSIDERRKVILPGNAEVTYQHAAEYLLEIGNRAQQEKGFFSLALSGGSTPIAIYQLLQSNAFREKLDWTKVLLFFSDERAVPPHHHESNYRKAFEEGRLKTLPLQKENVFRMQAETHLQENALAYETLIREKLGDNLFDLVLLGIGNDGHTASLFPENEALFVLHRLVTTASFNDKRGERMTLTFQAINQSKNILSIAIGAEKAAIIQKIFTEEYNPDKLPIQRIGSLTSPALFLFDDDASKFLSCHLK